MKPETPTKAELYLQRAELRVDNAILRGFVADLIQWSKSRGPHGEHTECHKCPIEYRCSGKCVFLDYAIARAHDLGIEVGE